MTEKDIFIIDAKRTAIGSFGGSLSTLPGHEIGKHVLSAIIKHNKIDPADLSEVILGQVLTAGCGQNPARQASINAGITFTVPAWGVSQVCGSGLRAVMLAAANIMAGDSNLVLAGGQESMSLAKHASFLRNGIKMGNGTFLDTMIEDGLTDAFHNYHMGITAENVAKKYNISKDEQDIFACNSQNKAEKAHVEGKFKDEIIPVTLTSKKGETIFAHDEFIRNGTTLETLAKLRPAFDKEGSVTAGNASGLNDGAAALLIADGEMVRNLNLKPMARIVSYAVSGVAPEIMGTGPISAVQKALAKASLTISDLDLIEANEAFASQAIAVNKELGWNPDIINVNGGAIALGHPIGASGARVLVTLLHEMKRRKAKRGLATLCIGGGMGVAMIVEM